MTKPGSQCQSGGNGALPTTIASISPRSLTPSYDAAALLDGRGGTPDEPTAVSPHRLVELDERIKTDQDPDGVAFNPSAAFVDAPDLLNLTTVAGDLDLAFEPGSGFSRPFATKPGEPRQPTAAAAKNPFVWSMTPFGLIPPAVLVLSSTTNDEVPACLAFWYWVTLPVQPPAPHDTVSTP